MKRLATNKRSQRNELASHADVLRGSSRVPAPRVTIHQAGDPSPFHNQQLGFNIALSKTIQKRIICLIVA